MSVSVANFGVADPVLESHLGEKKHDASKSSSQAVLPNYEDEGESIGTTCNRDELTPSHRTG